MKIKFSRKMCRFKLNERQKITESVPDRKVDSTEVIQKVLPEDSNKDVYLDVINGEVNSIKLKQKMIQKLKKLFFTKILQMRLRRKFLKRQTGRWR